MLDASPPRLIPGFPRRARALATAALVLCAAPALAQAGGQDPCADLGSFAIVDAPPAPRGQPLVAQPYQPCADLPGRPQPQIFIDAQVSVGPNGTGDAATGSGTATTQGTGMPSSGNGHAHGPSLRRR